MKHPNMKPKTILLTTLLGASTFWGCGSGSTGEYAKIKVRLGNPASGLSDSRFQFATATSCTAPLMKVVVTDTTGAVLASSDVTATLAPKDIESAASGTEVASDLSAEVNVPTGTDRVFSVVGAYYDTSDCKPAEGAKAYPIFGSTDPMEITESTEIAGEAWVASKAFSAAKASTDIAISDTDFVRATLNWAPKMIGCTDLQKVTVKDVDANVSFETTTGFSSAPSTFYVGPLMQYRDYELTVECNTGKKTSYFMTKSTAEHKTGIVFALD